MDWTQNVQLCYLLKQYRFTVIFHSSLGLSVVLWMSSFSSPEHSVPRLGCCSWMVCPPVSLLVSLPTHLFVCLPVCLFICLCLLTWLFLTFPHLFDHLPVQLSVYPPICWSSSLYVCVSDCQSVFLFTCLFVYMLSKCLSVCPPSCWHFNVLTLCSETPEPVLFKLQLKCSNKICCFKLYELQIIDKLTL